MIRAEIIRRQDTERNTQTNWMEVLHNAEPECRVGSTFELNYPLQYGQCRFSHCILDLTNGDPLNIDHLRDGSATPSASFALSVRLWNGKHARNEGTN